MKTSTLCLTLLCCCFLTYINAQVTVYGINNGTEELISFDATNPSTVTVEGNSPVFDDNGTPSDNSDDTFENAGAIDPFNPTIGYALGSTGEFYSIVLATGTYVYLGNITPPGLEIWWGMEFDPTDGTLYAISRGTDLNGNPSATLSSIDILNLSATNIGNTSLDVPAALAINASGTIYTFDVADDNLYSLDKTTGAATLIGSIGFDSQFGQGMCYDPNTGNIYMSAININDPNNPLSEWRTVNTSTGATTLVGSIGSSLTQVSWASIPGAAVTCPKPINLAVSNIGETTVDLSWDDPSQASDGYQYSIFISGDDPLTDTPVSTGTTTAGTTTASVSGLASGTAYDFYVTADCGATDGTSDLAGPRTFFTLPTCGDVFYDTGGPSQGYNSSETTVWTLSPVNTGDAVVATFTSFNIEVDFDALYVYDGPDTSAPLIDSGNPATQSGFPAGGYYGTTPPGPFTSTHATGTLTFEFRSDAFVNEAGWEANITCVPLGIEENAIKGFSYYPNPVSDVLSLSAQNSTIDNVSIYSLTGKKVYAGQLGAASGIIDVSKLATGIYMLKVSVNGQTGVYRLIVK